jgi:hypothetical protein
MKTLVSVLIAGALSTTGAFAGAAGTPPNVAGNDNTIATPQLPFRLFHKRPAGARQAAVAAPRVDVAAPHLPFRPYQKRPSGAPSNKATGIEAQRQ